MYSSALWSEQWKYSGVAEGPESSETEAHGVHGVAVVT